MLPTASASTSSRSLLTHAHRLRKTCPAGTRISTNRPQSPHSVRPFHAAPATRFPRKDSQHKDSINTEATEYSKSGTDDAAARQEEAAFDPSQTDPGAEKQTAGEGTGSGGNPLDVSPANQDISKPRGDQEGGAESSPVGGREGRERASGGGSPAKNKSPGRG